MLNNLQELKQYTPARLTKGKEWYISFYAFNPEINILQRKKIKINHIEKISDRIKYATELIKRINVNLSQGWNPFVDPETKKSYHKLSDAISHFLKIGEKKLNEGVIRDETYKDYVSYLRNLQRWLVDKKFGDIYLYKLDKTIISDFLEYIYVERDRAAQTRNNYLNIFRIFAGFLVEKDYTKFKITDGIEVLKKAVKQRTIIKQDDIKRIKDYLEIENKYFLFACQFLYFTFIRPREMSYLQLKYINFTKKTIFIPASISKNKKDAVITIPNSLGQLMIDLKIYDYPDSYYIFSTSCKPGPEHCSSKQFRTYWLPMRRKLKLPTSNKFYSLKDTGITDLLKLTGDPLLVRDQARHSSISITDQYTARNDKSANPQIAESTRKFGD